MNNTNPKVDFYFEKKQPWQEEFKLLRKIILDFGLAEELKWGCACYTLEEKNVVLIHGFKEYCALLFFKGALLNDPKGILIQQTENVHVPRQVRFTSLREIKELTTTLKAYIKNAIEMEKAGVRAAPKEKAALVFPEELQQKFDDDPDFKAAFDALTPGRQRGYNLYFTAPKQSKTRDARIEKSIPKILDGKGLED